LAPKLRLRGNLRAEHVTGGQVTAAIPLLDLGCLRALACNGN
jgi:hypothetical protein